ncbi:hypothetical protein ACTJJ7_15365 [Phyllobacterium sp. 22229]|uniref:hypothetical protein n=1 Tax=Phyllobacterium sp. 22229 TaxID=3453895 RepID=UPI003F84E283
MTPYEELVEKVARNICIAKGLDPDWNYDPTGIGGGLDHRWKCFTGEATAAIATILEALSEPSEAMVTAGMNELDTPFYADIERGYRAMLEASPLVEEERKTVENGKSTHG